MENIMSKWSRKFGKILTAAGVSAFIAVSSLTVPIEASAARAVTDDIMIRNDASREAGAIGSLQEGEEVTILDAVQSADGYVWYYIQLENGNTGYVRSDLIEASDEELAAINSGQPEEEQPQEAEPEEKAEEPEQEPVEEPAGQEQSTQEAAAAATQAAPAQTQDGEYDATKDPNASFRVSYDTDDSGNGEWYVHNDDNGSKWKVSDLQGQGGTAAQKGAVAGIWRTLAILFGIIAIALAAFVLFLLKSIRDGRSKTTRGRALEAAASGYDDDGDDSDDEYYFDDDEEDVSEDEDSEAEDAADDKFSESDESEEQKDQADLSEKVSDEKPVNTPDSTITMDVPSEPEITEIPTEEIEAAIAATTAQYEKSISDEGDKTAPAPSKASEEDKIERKAPLKAASSVADDDSEPEGFVEEAEQEEEAPESEISEGEDYSDEDYEDEDYEDEDYDDEDSDEYEDRDSDDDYEDEDYEDEDYEDDEPEEEDDDKAAGSRSRSSSKGGFFGFLKKMFGTDSSEDAEDEGEDFDDYDDEPEEHEFDEFKEYPEDIDLLPREEEPEEEEDPDDEDGDYSDQGADTAGSERGRLSMQRVMKNVSYKEEEADFSDEDDLSDSLFEDDDDMEYSFISNTRNKK